MIKLMVGLGNPGRQYEETRHNAGFLFLDVMASKYGVTGWQSSSQFHGEILSCNVAGDKLILLKPMQFMNRSGLSVAVVLKYYKFKLDELLVVHDELELPEGCVKIKSGGGHAGHNGLRDIITHLGAREFYRLRVGIGRPKEAVNVADYVLSKPSSQASINQDSCYQLLASDAKRLIDTDLDAINKLF